jgi:ectoine hydroxylase
MNTKMLLRRFEQNGYLLLDNFFDPALMQRLDSHILEHFGDDPAFLHTDEFLEKAKTDVIPWFPQDEGQIDFGLVDDSADLRHLTGALLGDAWHRLNCMVMFSKQGTMGQAWHQDCAPEHAAQYNLNRLVYTSDIDDETGGQTVIVPGSHRRGLLPPGDPWADLEGQQILRPRVGTLVLLHGHVWHRVLPIRDRYRYSTNYRAVPAGTATNVTDICVYRNMRYQFSTETVVEERTA